MKQLRSVDEMTPDELARLRPEMRERLGQCYSNAGRRLLDEEDRRAVLVHGTIQGFGYPPNPHAWVKYPGHPDIVWDPTLGKEFPAEVFERLFNARSEAEYTVDEARVAMLAQGHWGPWHDEQEVSA